jgi:hypothetical protein
MSTAAAAPGHPEAESTPLHHVNDVGHEAWPEVKANPPAGAGDARADCAGRRVELTHAAALVVPDQPEIPKSAVCTIAMSGE